MTWFLHILTAASSFGTTVWLIALNRADDLRNRAEEIYRHTVRLLHLIAFLMLLGLLWPLFFGNTPLLLFLFLVLLITILIFRATLIASILDGTSALLRTSRREGIPLQFSTAQWIFSILNLYAFWTFMVLLPAVFLPVYNSRTAYTVFLLVLLLHVYGLGAGAHGRETTSKARWILGGIAFFSLFWIIIRSTGEIAGTVADIGSGFAKLAGALHEHYEWASAKAILPFAWEEMIPYILVGAILLFIISAFVKGVVGVTLTLIALSTLGLLGAWWYASTADPYARVDRAIVSESQGFVANAMTHTATNNTAVRKKSVDGTSTPAQEGQALMAYAREAWPRIQDRERALAAARGSLEGEFIIPSNHPIREPRESWFQPVRIVLGEAVPLRACAPGAILTTWGAVLTHPTERLLNLWSGPPGWPIEVPAPWRRFRKLHDEAPFMALLVGVGTAAPEYRWEPIGEGQYRMVILIHSGCYDIRFAVNDLAIDPQGWRINATFSENTGRFIGTLKEL
jgi:hypothetical protein